MAGCSAHPASTRATPSRRFVMSRDEQGSPARAQCQRTPYAMRALFVVNDLVAAEPLGVMQLASVLRGAGHEVRLAGARQTA